MSKKVTLDEVCGTQAEHYTSTRAYTLKVHIMLEHVNTFVENVGGGLSRRGNDQVTEAAHQLLHQRMIRSHYWVRKVGTESEGKALFRAVVHTNSYNL